MSAAMAISGIVGLNTRMTQEISDQPHFELHILATRSEQIAIDLIAENCLLSKQKIKSVMTNGAVWLESDIGIHRLRRAKKVLGKNNSIHLYYDKEIQQTKPETATLIADEKEYSVWNKPYGMYSQGTKWGDHCSIYRWAETHLKPQRPAFLVHRLDRAASGLIIIAHTKKIVEAFSDMFKDRKIQKRYRAIVSRGSVHRDSIEGIPDDLTLPYTIDSEIDGKAAVSKIIAAVTVSENVSERTNKQLSLTIEIETGRKHQIRRHLAESGFPIIGDRLYGPTDSQERPDENLQLQSIYLKFKCPLTNITREYSL